MQSRIDSHIQGLVRSLVPAVEGAVLTPTRPGLALGLILAAALIARPFLY